MQKKWQGETGRGKGKVIDKNSGAKCEAEKLVLRYHKEYGMPTTVIRILAVYGSSLVYGMVKLFQTI